jgi:hypothetical protein
MMRYMNRRALRPLFQIALIVALLLVVGIVIVGCLVTLAIIYPAPTYRIAASQFNTSRSVLANDAPDDIIASQLIGDFVQESYEIFASQPDFQRKLIATYKHQDGFGAINIRLTVFLLSDKEFRSKLISQEAKCIDYGGSVQIQAENGITYTYAYCNHLGYSSLILLWENGDWVIKAESPAVDQLHADLLVQFVNNYPF